jgi:hypothetical protein
VKETVIPARGKALVDTDISMTGTCAFQIPLNYSYISALDFKS